MKHTHILPLVVEKEGFTLDLWEKIAFGLAYGNREHADQSYHEIVKKSAQFDQKEKELSHKIEHIKSLGSPANPSLAFLVCGGVGILMGLSLIHI